MDHSTTTNALAYLLLSLGIQSLPNEFVGGLFLAVSGGYFAAIWMPAQDRRDMRLMVATSVIVATLAAIAHPKVAPGWPLPLIMGLSGLFARYAIAIVLGISSRTMSKTDQIADGAIKKVFGQSDETNIKKDEEK